MVLRGLGANLGVDVGEPCKTFVDTLECIAISKSTVVSEKKEPLFVN